MLGERSWGGPRRTRRRSVGVFAALCVVLILSEPATGEPFRTVPTPVRLVATGPVPTSVAGLSDYFGTLEITAASDGLVVVNRLPLERYLLGLNEVPPDWPAEALKAQAIAARTYALWTLARPPAGSAATYGFDICASTECQVFTGADVLSFPQGGRWIDAVEETSGTALLYDDEPILARYHSVSGGHTLDNSQAFPDEPDFPYLEGVPSPTEESSPLYNWRVLFRLDLLRRILQRVGWWDSSTLTEVRTVPSRTGLHYPDVVMSGPRRRVVRTAQEFRAAVGAIAPLVRPGRYPSLAPTSSGRLPETFPSNRMTISTQDDLVEVDGAGWGHGVGMSQWGAYGMAREGADAESILAHYYRGAELRAVDSPGALEVGVDWARRHVEVTGAFRMVDGEGRTIVARAVGTWGLAWEGPGLVSVTAPAGLGRPLRIAVHSAPEQVGTGRVARIGLTLSRPAEIRATGGGSSSAPAIGPAGKSRVDWRAPSTPGRYRVEVRADAGGGHRARSVVTIAVVAPRGPAGSPSQAEGAGPGALIGALLGVALIAIGVTAFAGTMRR
jgi:stage II sporulation protein D